MTCHYLPTVLLCGFLPGDDVLLQFYAPDNFFFHIFLLVAVPVPLGDFSRIQNNQSDHCYFPFRLHLLTL